MAGALGQIMQKPVVAHLLRANTRFNSRLGTAFAAAITYFSVLSLIPIAFLAVLTVSIVLAGRSDLVVDALGGALGQETGEGIAGALQGLQSKAGLAGVIGVLSAAYAGAGWVAQLKSAVRAQWRPSLDDTEDKSNIVVETLLNLLILIGLLVLVMLTFALSSVATSLTGTIVRVLSLDAVPGINLLLRLVPILASVLVGFVLFNFLYRVLPQERISGRHVLKGCLAGSVGLLALQYGSSALFGVFGGNAAVAAFGPVIVLMLFFNLFARLILFIAAWIATSEQRAIAGEHIDADTPLEEDPDIELEPVITAAPEVEAADRPAQRARQAWSRREDVQIGPEVLQVQYPDENVSVPQTVAVRSTRIASAVGWALGAASGVGLGAAITAALRRRRP